MSKLNSSSRKINGFILVIIILLVWEFYSRFISKSIFLTPVSIVLSTFFTQLFNLTYLGEIGTTLARWLSGYLISAFIMIPLGILMGKSKFIYNLFEPLVEFFRPLPSASIIPIAILFLGIGAKMKLFVIFFGASWPILINAVDGVRGIEPTYIQTGFIFGLSKNRIMKEIIIPASLPNIFTGLRISMAIALILAITVEMIAGGDGIGYYILDAERSFHFAEMYSGVLTIGLIGYFLNLLFIALENKVLWWYKESKKISK